IADIEAETPVSDRIANLRKELASTPDNLERQLELARLLGKGDDTNATELAYAKAEQLCRRKCEAHPQDGLALTDLADALWGLKGREEAERYYRRAVLVSWNEWRCWTGLGEFLDSRAFDLLLPEGCRLSSESVDAIMDYHPPGNTLNEAEACHREAEPAFDR